MVSFDLSFRSILINDIVEDEEAYWTEGRISWVLMNGGSYHIKWIQVVNGGFCPCVSISVLLLGGGGGGGI